YFISRLSSKIGLGVFCWFTVSLLVSSKAYKKILSLSANLQFFLINQYKKGKIKSQPVYQNTDTHQHNAKPHICAREVPNFPSGRRLRKIYLYIKNKILNL